MGKEFNLGTNLWIAFFTSSFRISVFGVADEEAEVVVEEDAERNAYDGSLIGSGEIWSSNISEEGNEESKEMTGKICPDEVKMKEAEGGSGKDESVKLDELKCLDICLKNHSIKIKKKGNK